ncbi:MAG: glycoside hydrolase family 127 protein [Clostridia bacterium]|nr:glycoside hydrolase family 127 protein [Clostridia bacterium]
MKNIYSYLPNGAAVYENAVHENAVFILKKQLMDKPLWDKFVYVFTERPDHLDLGWRGEYFGKMMRGACLTYRYIPDEELYNILYETVKGILDTQDADGRITTYPQEKEFCGWDMWTRKYVIVGCLYFYGICRDEAFKEKIITALKGQVDYLMEKLGEDKLSILDTSTWWGGLNSSSILEPIVELYKLTKEEKYLSFAQYILEAGGCKDGNLLALAEAGEKMPYEYPVVKAYEMMSYFEGALAYYEVTGETRYLNIVEKFADAVRKTDITIIGCAGCTHELFDHSAVKQTEETEPLAIMQETCVTVTWMRLLDRLLRLTGKVIYAEGIEQSTLNALYGSLNYEGLPQLEKGENIRVPGVPFDSYSPLTFKARGIGIGGYKKFSIGGYYGCCACIGAAGTALFPLISVMTQDNGFVLNEYNNGTVNATTPAGNPVTLRISGYFADEGHATVTLALNTPETFTLRLRVPAWSHEPTVTVNGETQNAEAGYVDLTREWKDGDSVTIECYPEVEITELNGKIAFTYGALALARDEQKEDGNIEAPVVPVLHNGHLVVNQLDVLEGETVRFTVKTEAGDLLLTDYASCGKHWMEERNRISVWLNR